MTFHLSSLLSTIALAVVLWVNYTAGQTLGNLDQIFPFLTMPPGITFAVSRSIIYLSLIAAVISWRSMRVNRTKHGERVMNLFWISCLFNIGRIYVTIAQEYIVGVALLGCLCVVLYYLLSYVIHYKKKLRMMRIVITSFGLYLGRILVATLVIGTTQIIHISVGPTLSLSIGRSVASLILGVIAISRIIKKTTIAVGVLPLWALTMIAIKNALTLNYTISIFCILGIIIIGSVMIHKYTEGE